jgi:predicted metal-dependent HD superfamily phosphohydrolase
MLSIESFNTTLAQLGLAHNPEIFHELSAAYGASDRHYHNFKHVEECLRALKQHEDLADSPSEIAMALWFHDAIYDTHRNDNEALSAAWARTSLTSAGLASDVAGRIHDLIIATKHNVAVERPDEKLLIDIDLGILGQPESVFASYNAAISIEYNWVSPALYQSGRIAVLQSFLDRGSIYNTVRFRTLYESQARKNIAHAIDELEQIDS